MRPAKEIRGKSGRLYSENEYLFVDELADALRRNRSYVYAMKKAGFRMPGRSATYAEARSWLQLHVDFSTTKYHRAASGEEEPRKTP